MRELLEEADMRSSDILKKLKLMGISERTAHSVKKELVITSYKSDGI